MQIDIHSILKTSKNTKRTINISGHVNCANENGIAAKYAASFSNSAARRVKREPAGKRNVFGTKAKIPINIKIYIIGENMIAGIFARGVKRFTPPKIYKIGIRTRPDVTVPEIKVSFKL